MGKRHYRSAVAMAAATAAAFSVAGPTSASPSTNSAAFKASTSGFDSSSNARERKGYYDARQVAATGQAVAALKALKGPAGARVGALRTAIGPDAVVDIDPLTGTPANVASQDGFLTGRSSAPAKQVALSYVRRHLTDLGLRKGDLATLRLRKAYVDVIGTHHLSWTQSVRGVTVFGNGLEAHVTKAGELIAIQGSPVAGLGGLTSGKSNSPQLSAAAARIAAAQDVGGSADSGAVQRASRTAGTSVWSNGDRAELVWFATPSGTQLGWSTYTQAGDSLDYSHVIDAGSGAVLYRRDLVSNDRGDAKVYDYYPGASSGGDPKQVNFFRRDWLNRSADWLTGVNASAWADLDDDNSVGDNEKTPVPGTANRAQFNLVRFNGSNDLCSNKFICTWNANKRFSWRANKEEEVTNLFYLGNTFHDYLAREPIGFTTQAGNFERADGDPVLMHGLDGANTDNGFPDGGHIDNANMSTPPDGTPPTMQMYLWHFPKTPNELEPFVPVGGSFDATIVYHEYTHGLSNRLVVDAQGNSTLNSIQAGAMGEAWSDWYAMDYLVAKGFQKDSNRKDGEIRLGKYVLADQFPFRTMAMDCEVRSDAKPCTDPITGKRGGYTYGDFPNISGTPGVHAGGEVWAQTLWDIREELGHRVTAMLVTRGMELAANDPDMLDMRNAILQADKVAYAGSHTNALWRMFAHRGMGWYAGSIDAGDVQPAEDFHTPPKATRGFGTLAGFVTDRNTDEPLVGAKVTITGHPEYTDRTNEQGIYQIDFVRPGTYQKVVLNADGYEVIVKQVRIRGDFKQKDFSARRDWAASSGGGAIVDFTGPDYSSFGCGPDGAIDLSQGTIWGSSTGDDSGAPTGTIQPKYIVVELPEPINITTGKKNRSAFAVDPTAGCGDAGSASTGGFTIAVSPTGAAGSYVKVAQRKGENHWLPRFRYTNVKATAPAAGVQFVRFTIKTPQVPDFATNCPDGNFSGCSFMDLTELEVFGTPSAP